MKNLINKKILTVLVFVFSSLFFNLTSAVENSVMLPSITPSAEKPWFLSTRLNPGDNPTIQGVYKTEIECNTALLSYKATNKTISDLSCLNFYNTQKSASSTENSSNDKAQEVKGEYKNQETDTTTYNLLAPIGKLKSISSMTMSDYFNTIISILIGICAVLAVVMIVVGGVQWMGSSVFGKSEGKGRITNAIIGLVLALGSYALLNTVNPDLLGVKGLSIKQVSATIDEESEQEPWEGSSVGDNTKLCTQGFKMISVPWGVEGKKNLNICGSIETNVTKLLNDAKKATIILSGSGSRTKAEQQSLRVKNGCPNPETAASKCSPATARPGHSMHEAGLAIDFRCDNKKMTGNDACFAWLKENAKKYGLYNLPSEPWHWSTTGK